MKIGTPAIAAAAVAAIVAVRLGDWVTASLATFALLSLVVFCWLLGRIE